MPIRTFAPPITTLPAGSSKIGKIDVSSNVYPPNFTTFNSQVVTVTTAGVPVTPSACIIPDGFALVIKAKASNTKDIYIGFCSASALDEATRFTLQPNEAVILNLSNFNQVYIDAEVSGEKAELIAECE